MAETAVNPARASLADWVAVMAGALGALMAVLDISITNSALPTIQGSVGASGSEGTWIGSGYLMAESVMIPLAAWLSRVFGLRRFLIVNATLFSLFSLMCGMADSLPMLIIGRIGQGFAGGAMIPTAQSIMRTRLPASQFPLGMTIFGLTVLLGPLLGPLVGGWLTTNFGWHWCFFINLPIGAVLVGLLLVGMKPDRVNWSALRSSDWPGIIGLAVCLSTLTLVLEDGQREQWFQSNMIVWLSFASLCGFAVLLMSQRRAKQPVIRLSVLRNANFASVVIMATLVGVVTYSTSYVVPQFLGSIAGYNAQDAGNVMMYTALPALVLMPILPRLLGRTHPRTLIVLGLILLVASCIVDTGLTSTTSGSDFALGQLLRGAGQLLCSMPLNQASMACVSREESGEAAGIFSMARNLGGSIGLALTGALIDRREAFHSRALSDTLNANSTQLQEHLLGQSAGLMAQTGDLISAQAHALAQLASSVQREALVMAFSDTFSFLIVALMLCVPLTLMLKAPKRVSD
jgi:DHA2 family multidrug resistance protein